MILPRTAHITIPIRNGQGPRFSELRRDIRREGLDVSIVTFGDDTKKTTENGETAEAGNAGSEDGSGIVDDGSEDEAGGQVDILQQISDTLDDNPDSFDSGKDMAGIALGIPDISVPEHLGEVKGRIKLPLTVFNRSGNSVMFSLSGMIHEDKNYLVEKKSLELPPGTGKTMNVELELPEDVSEGENSLEFGFELIGGLRVNPRTVRLNFTYVVPGGVLSGLAVLSDWKFIAIAAACILAAVILFLIKKLSGRASYRSGTGDAAAEQHISAESKKTGSKPQAKTQQEAEKKAEAEELDIIAGPESDEADAYNKNRPIRMLVYGQNTRSGVQNVKWLGTGQKRSVGGAASADFRIFLVRVPNVIGRIECTVDDFIFYPDNAGMFPELDGPLKSCLGKRIKVINGDNRIFYIEFRQWISELEKINRLLAMVRKPGRPDFEY